MTIPQQILTIVAVVLGTMTTRFLPFLFFPEGKEPPAFVRYLGAVLPSAVIGLLVVFCLKDAVFIQAFKKTAPRRGHPSNSAFSTLLPEKPAGTVCRRPLPSWSWACCTSASTTSS